MLTAVFPKENWMVCIIESTFACLAHGNLVLAHVGCQHAQYSVIFTEITKDFLGVMEKAEPKLKKHIMASLKVVPDMP